MFFRILILLSLALPSSGVGAKAIHIGPGQQFPDLGSASRARVVKPGDSVLIHSGTYINAVTWIDSLFGTPDSWITICPFEQDSVSIHEQYTFSKTRYVRIERLHWFGNDASQSARVYHLLQFDYSYDCFTNHHIIVDRCTFTDLNNTGKQGSGAFVKFTGTDSFWVENCLFRNGTNVADGISMNGNKNGWIRHSMFENISGYGSHTKGGTQNITFEANWFIDCNGAGIDVGGDTGPQFFCPLGAPWEADSIKVFSNVFIRGAVGVQLSSAHHSIIANNTFFKQRQFAFRLLNASSNNVFIVGNYIANNIFTMSGPNGIYLNASAGGDYTKEIFENNLFHDYARPDPKQLNWSEMSGAVVSGSIIADPGFLDTAKRDFRLWPDSPAVKAGVTVSGVNRDFTGKPYASPRSLGAFEATEAPSRVKPADPELKLWPQPVTDVLNIDGNLGGKVEILDLLGRVVMALDPGVRSWDVSGLASGCYFVRAGEGVYLVVKR